MKLSNLELNWLGHAAFRITDLIDSRIIYIDPFKINENSKKADIVLITHSHYDHCSIEDLKKICTESTIIIAPAETQSSFQGKIDMKQAVMISPERKISLGNITIEAVFAYNTNKPFHSKDNEWIGYIIDINSKRIYHAGDTDLIPEMKNIKNIDVAILPVSGKYTMTASEAAKAANMIQPEIAIPMHYGEIIGDLSDAESFKTQCSCKVEILEKQEN